MALSNSRMRLTVEVLPLHYDGSRGPLSSVHSEALKGRKFALPVQLEHTFEQVWAQVEERYKRNYLTKEQAAGFTIQKLQDAYDCDLDLTDTVSAIFEGESDPSRRMIKVVPSFINRDFSVPFTSNLLPAHAQKRIREIKQLSSGKRRRLDEDLENADLNQGQNRPLPSTESETSGDDIHQNKRARTAREDSIYAQRSKSASSVVFVQNNATGNEEFEIAIKEESPELGSPSRITIPESEFGSSQSPDTRFKKPELPASRSIATSSQQAPSATRSPRQTIQRPRSHASSRGASAEVNLNDMEDIIMEDNVPDIVGSQGQDQNIVVDASQNLKNMTPNGMLESTTPGRKVTSSKLTSRSLKKTYGRHPRTPQLARALNSPFNHDRSSSVNGEEAEHPVAGPQRGIVGNARSFQTPKVDAIVSTQDELEASADIRPSSEYQEGLMNGDGTGNTSLAATATTEAPKVGKTSGLKRPSRLSYKLDMPGAAKTPGRGSKTPVPTPITSKASGAPAFRRSVSTTSSSRVAAESPSLGAREGRVQPQKEPVETTSPGPSSGRPQSVSRRFATAVVVENPSPVSSKERLAAIRKKLARRKSEAPQSSPSQISGSRSFSPEDQRKLKKVKTAQTVQLEVEDKPPEPESPHPVSNKEPQHSTVEDVTPTQAFKMPVPKTVAAVEAPSSSALSVPKHTPIPLPENVRHLSKEYSAGSSDEQPVTGDKPSKNPKQGPAKPVPSLEKPMNNLMRESSESSSVARSTPTRTDPPLPENVRHLLSQKNDETPSTETKAVTRTQIPLPENIRHLYKNGTTDTKVDHVKTPSAAPEPKVPKKRGRPPKSATKETPTEATKPTKETLTKPIKPTKKAPIKSSQKVSKKVPVEAPNDGAVAERSLGENKKDIWDVDSDPLVKFSSASQSQKPVSSSLSPKKENLRHDQARDPLPTASVPAPSANEPILLSSGVSSSSLSESDDDSEGEIPARPFVGEVAKEDGPFQNHGDAADSGLDADAVEEQIIYESGSGPLREAAEHPKRTGTKSWTTETWGFHALDQQAAASNETDAEEVAEVGSLSRHKSPSDEGSEFKPEHEAASEPDSEEGSKSKSRSASGVESARSSPLMSRGPARFLSHSPTPEKSSSEDESEAEAVSPRATPGGEETKNESESSSSSSESDDDEDASDVEMADADANADTTTATAVTTTAPASSPPPPHSYARRFIPTPQPSSSQTPRPPASQPNPSRPQTIQAAAQTGTQTIGRPSLQAARRSMYQKFPSIGDQLKAARSGTPAQQKPKAFDPKTQSLAKLAKMKAQAKGKTVALSESSSDDESSSSSSSESDAEEKRAGCSVA